MRRTTAGLLALAIFLISSSAWAIDGYQDRHGVFYGGGLGGGPGSVSVADEPYESGMDGTGALGLATHLVVGGGASDNLVFGAELNNWIRTVNVYDNRLNHQQWSANAIGNFFVVHGFFVEAGVGLAYAYSDASTQEGDTRRYQEMGLAGKLGVGFEYFLNGTMAAGFGLNYTRHFYENLDFDTVTGAVRLRWY